MYGKEQIEKLGGFCQTTKKKLLYTEDRLQVAREEIEYISGPMEMLIQVLGAAFVVTLNTSFEAQVNTTDDAQVNISAVQEETINTVAALVKKLLTLMRGKLSS